MSSFEDIRRKVLLRLNMDGTQSKSTLQLLDDFIGEICMEIASDNYFYELVKSKEDTTNSEGQYTLNVPAIPYQVFIHGTFGEDNTWQRVTPITYDYYIRWKDGSSRGGVGGGAYTGSRYTVIPTGNDDLCIDLLEINDAVTIKVYYYPIRPTPSDFPGYFEPLIIEKVLYLYGMNQRESSSEQFFGRTEKRIKQLEKNIKKIATQVEIVGAPSGVYNAQTRDWMSSNDLGFYKGL